MNWNARTKITQAYSDVTTDIAKKNYLIIHLELCTHKKKRVENRLNVKGGKKKVRKKIWYSLFFFFSPEAESPLSSVNSHNTLTTEKRQGERKWKTRHSKRQREKPIVVHWKQIVLSESCLSPKYMRGEKRIGRKIRKKIGKTDRMKQWSINKQTI